MPPLFLPWYNIPIAAPQGVATTDERSTAEAMKIEIGPKRPERFTPAYPEMFDLFSHLEVSAAIPQALFAITTWKENGKPNLCFHSWGSFHGDRTAFFAVMGNLFQHTHTYANLRREGCFCLNFLPVSCYDRLSATIEQNGPEEDEFAVGGFSLEEGKAVHAPRIGESFLTMECTLRELRDLTGQGQTAMEIGQVVRVAVEESYARGLDKRYGPEGFMMLLPAPQNLLTGEPSPSGVATLRLERLD